MNELQTLRQKRACAIQLAGFVLRQSGADKRAELNENERAKYDEHMGKAAELNQEIKALDRNDPGCWSEADLDKPLPRQSKPMQPGSVASAAAGLSDGGFANVGELMQALFRKNKNLGMDDRLMPLQASTMGNYSDSLGGFAVPEQFVAAAFETDFSTSEVLLNLADRVVMTADKMSAPVFSDYSHAVSPYGLAWGQIGETSQIGDTNATLRGISMEAGKHGALVNVSNEWLQDADPAMQARLQKIFIMSLRHYVEGLCWNGHGGASAIGVLTSPALLTIPKEAGQAADTITVNNVLQMFARSLPGSESRLVWVCNKTCLPALATLTIDAGTAGSPVGLLQTDASAPMRLSMLGRPLYFSEHLPVLGNAGDIALIDPLSYVIGERKMITIDTSQHLRFDYDMTTFRILTRFNAQPTMGQTFTPKNGETCGFAVVVAAR